MIVYIPIVVDYGGNTNSTATYGNWPEHNISVAPHRRERFFERARRRPPTCGQAGHLPVAAELRYIDQAPPPTKAVAPAVRLRDYARRRSPPETRLRKHISALRASGVATA